MSECVIDRVTYDHIWAPVYHVIWSRACRDARAGHDIHESGDRGILDHVITYRMILSSRKDLVVCCQEDSMKRYAELCYRISSASSSARTGATFVSGGLALGFSLTYPHPAYGSP